MSWQFAIRDDWACAAQEILVYQRVEGVGIEMIVIENPVLKRVIVKESELVKEPTLRINYDMAKDLFPAIAEALDKRGIKPPSRSYAEGELAATKMHLGDMRDLVFRGGKNEQL